MLLRVQIALLPCVCFLHVAAFWKGGAAEDSKSVFCRFVCEGRTGRYTRIKFTHTPRFPHTFPAIISHTCIARRSRQNALLAFTEQKSKAVSDLFKKRLFRIGKRKCFPKHKWEKNPFLCNDECMAFIALLACPSQRHSQRNFE